MTERARFLYVVLRLGLIADACIPHVNRLPSRGSNAMVYSVFRSMPLIFQLHQVPPGPFPNLRDTKASAHPLLPDQT